MGSSQKRKGNEGERELVRLLNKAGVECRKTPMSGALHFWKGDVEFAPYFENGIKGEIKRRKKINNLFYDMLKEARYGFIRGDNKSWLVVMDLDEFAEMYKAWRNAGN